MNASELDWVGLYEGVWNDLRNFQNSFSKGTPCFCLLLGKDDGLVLKIFCKCLVQWCLVNAFENE